MTRLIDADAIDKRYVPIAPVLCGDDVHYEWVAFIEDINKLPTVDAVPVIRCYECKYFKEFEKGFSSDWDGSCRYWNTHSTVYSNFCGCGARMDEE